MIKLLGISGSPRKGSTEYAVKEALKAAEELPGIETEYWSVRGKKIGYCIHCDKCIREKALCYIEDDARELMDKVLEADGFIVGSPVYDMGITAQLTACFNRMRPFYMVKPGALKNKVGGVITLGGTRHGGQETAIQVVHNWFFMSEILVTGGVSGCYNGGKVWTRDDKAAGAEADTVGMNTVYGLGKGVAEAALVAAMGRKLWADKGLKSAGPVEDHEVFQI